MKKWMGGLASAALAALLLAGCGSNNTNQAGSSSAESSANTGGSGEPTKLVISTWGFSEDFFNQEVYAPFEKAHNVKIVVETGNNAERLNKIRQGSSSVDIMYLSDYYAQQAIDEGLFEKIDRSKIPNINDIYGIAKAPLGEDYGPAYTVGRLGIVYNPSMVKKEVTSWSDLWGPDFKNNLALPNITATAGPMILDAASNVAMQTTFNEDKAFEKLKELNPSVVKYYTQTSDFVNMFSQEEIAGGPIMESYFKDLKAAVPDAKFVSPKEGAYAIMNTVNIVKGSKNKELAEEFINWHLSKEVQEASAKAKVDSPVNEKVELTDAETEGITYGPEIVNGLVKLDMKFVNDNMKEWTDRWNRELAQ
ncbi:spermidine/putrescine ABC transporter substrate-binding protein [Paenibacillus yonginensis]|uniref:Spermidine/putrescine ABC transporter substrate-binding protein n=1 Tax=Paenibacillus yonginensis TaxID=1462996 RepID=A0A1B1N008_9BACL|nr:ABC transporter substrate-binding protein [Paenibacillus yonginensis]ANS74748.1 spermidine/putrescine ABC transporter substrate-binding protein [Paenibacillus yonginensis]